MKKILYLSILAIIALFSSCDDKDTEGISGITEFPIITVLGDELILVEKGSAFSDPGATSSGGEEISVTDVDTDQIGIYIVEYSAVNPEGIDGISTRTVIVHDPSIVGADVSGNIHDTNSPSRVGVISLVEGTTSIFYCTDMGGGGILPLYFQMDGDEMYVIDQPYDYSTVDDADGIYDPIAKTFDITFSTGWNYVFAYD